MKRRKWWCVGLALTLLAACVGAWKWTERPPYRFLLGHPRIYAAYDPGSGLYSEYYAFSQTCFELDKAISAEVERDKMLPIGDWVPAAMTHWRSYGPVTLHDYDGCFDHAFWDRYAPGPIPKHPVHVPKNIHAVVEVVRRPTPLDRVRAWLYGFRYDAPP